MGEPSVVGYDLANLKNQQLSSYPRSDYSLQVAVMKARLGLGYVCSCQEMRVKHLLSGNGGSGVKSVTLRCNEVELCVR